MSTETMPNWLMKRAQLTPERIACVYGQQSLTFRALDQRARRTAISLLEQGVKQGDRVAILMKNSLHTVELIHALHYVGAVLVPLNTRLTVSELRWQMIDAGACMLIYDDGHVQVAQALARALNKVTVVACEQLTTVDDVRGKHVPLKSTFALSDLQAIMYTSGTTGHPKGVMLTYGNHWWSAIGSSLNLGLHIDDRWLVCVPLFHMSGLSIVMRSVIYGITMVIHESFVADVANEAILEEGVTIVSVVSAMLVRMLDSLGTAYYPASFRCMLLGGGPAPLSLLERCRKKNIPVYQTYGLTETASQIATLSPEYMLDKLGSAGKPLFPSELRIMENSQEQRPGKAGEIVVKGPSVTQGYWKRAEETAHVLRDGWLYTGDIGYLDAEGFLYVLDRRSDLIISGGENVYPAEIEAVLSAHPSIAEAGVTGIADEKWGEVPVAFVVLKQQVNVTEDELKQFCHDKLANYKQPVRIHIVDKLPRNAANKLLRRKLLDTLSGKQAD